MRISFRSLLFASSSLFAIACAPASAQSKNPADYPLRVLIFNRNETTFYHNRYADEAKGEGRLNLFATGEVHGVDFTFDCPEKLKDSFGYQTFPAKWRRPDKELTVLLPVFGKTGSYFTCTFKTDVKTFAYTRHNGQLVSEPGDAYKAWMVKHDYDPEHGKDSPTPAKADAQAPQPASKPSSQQN
jgi:hypothetical protein